MASDELSSLSTPTNETEQVCSLCTKKYKQPRVLSCLHVYCHSCLEKLLQDGGGSNTGFLFCPECNQKTKLSGKGIAGLQLDYVTCNQLDLTAIESTEIVCTSCKAKENAVARCCDCCSFLCENCVTAHKYMRCFDNHQVVSFKDMKDAGNGFVHKPLTCTEHSGEIMKYYCYTCETLICNECIMEEHKQPEHLYERAIDAEHKQREELQNLVAESRSKVKFCEEASSNLEACLTELQMQRDNAKSYIQETFHSYRAILEKCLEETLKKLEEVHSAQEIRVMDTYHSVEKTIEKIEDACRFTERLLKHGNTMEILSLKQVVGSQLLYLINNTPKPDINVEITFKTEPETFERAAQKTFGTLTTTHPSLKIEDTPSSRQPSPLRSTPPFDESYALPSGVLSPDLAVPHHLDMDLENNMMAHFNLAQLAGMADNSVSQSTTTPTPSPPLSLSDLLIPATSSDPSVAAAAQLNALNNLSALAKLGSLSLNNSGQLTLNGQVVPGLTLDSLSQRPDGLFQSHLFRSLQSPSLETGIGNLLNGGGILTPSRGSSPHFDSSLLSSSTSSLLSRNLPQSPILSSNVIPSLPGQPSYNPPPRSATVKLNTMQIRCKFGQLGPGKGQFSSPHGFCLGVDEELIVADTNNHRIQVFDKMGEFKYQFGVSGKEEGELWYPRKVAVIRSSGKFVICDRGNERSRMQIFTKAGHFLRKIAIRYIDIVAGLAITSEGHIVAVDSVSPTVFVIAESGDLLRWFDCSEYMREPSDIAISGKEFHICDFKGHCVIVFNEEGQYLRRIGCENLTNFPNGIDISDAGDILVGDSHGNRFHVVVFSRNGTMLSEFECPYVKVSRCCGLKITSEGYIVTLAKNNHHVLILNTLYIV